MSQFAQKLAYQPSLHRQFREIGTGLFSDRTPESILLLPVNAYVKNNGKAVMAKGCGLVAKQRFRGIDLNWGEQLELQGRRRGNSGMLKSEAVGNHPTIIWDRPRSPLVIACPTQWHFMETADLSLIQRSLATILAMADKYEWTNIYLPELGCGAGSRDYRTEIKPILADYLDSRFIVCHLTSQDKW